MSKWHIWCSQLPFSRLSVASRSTTFKAEVRLARQFTKPLIRNCTMDGQLMKLENSLCVWQPWFSRIRPARSHLQEPSSASRKYPWVPKVHEAKCRDFLSESQGELNHHWRSKAPNEFKLGNWTNKTCMDLYGFTRHGECCSFRQLRHIYFDPSCDGSTSDSRQSASGNMVDVINLTMLTLINLTLRFQTLWLLANRHRRSWTILDQLFLSQMTSSQLWRWHRWIIQTLDGTPDRNQSQEMIHLRSTWSQSPVDVWWMYEFFILLLDRLPFVHCLVRRFLEVLSVFRDGWFIFKCMIAYTYNLQPTTAYSNNN